MKLIEDKPNETSENNKCSKEEKITMPSRSMSLDSNTLGMNDNSKNYLYN